MEKIKIDGIEFVICENKPYNWNYPTICIDEKDAETGRYAQEGFNKFRTMKRMKLTNGKTYNITVKANNKLRKAKNLPAVH